ncbi:MAG: HAMP domain-containing protein [Deltaproteobacteria bacterium]|nr:HAMP domain-containing protein [Deltaproteobacteria bacterium]
MTRIWGIRAQIITAMVIITIAAIGFMGVLSLKVVESSALHRKAREGELLAEFMIHKYRDGFGAFSNYIGSSVASGRIGGAVVKDKSGRIVLRKGSMPESREGNLLRYEWGLSVKLVDAGFFSLTGSNLLVTTSLIDGWKISYTLPLREVEDELSGIRRFILYFAIIDSLIIIILGVYLLSMVVIRPIRKLDLTARRIAEGSVGERATLDGYNEISSLAASFNTMAESLEEKIGHLERVNKDLVSTQESLLTSQKLATAGRLAAGIAHEIGNPLGAVLGYVDLLIKGVDDESEEREILRRIESETVRINNIVREFLDISRPSRERSAEAVKPICAGDVVDDALALFESQNREGRIEVVVNLNDPLPTVMAERDRMKQVMLNLLMNARDAMPEGGRMTISGYTVDYACESVSLPQRRSGDEEGGDYRERREMGSIKRGVAISVSDTGSGIKEEDMGGIFDPFFTTKEPGKGTGLGLFVSREIVQLYGGDIRVKSRSGEGTTFEILLPVAEGEDGGNSALPDKGREGEVR